MRKFVTLLSCDLKYIITIHHELVKITQVMTKKVLVFVVSTEVFVFPGCPIISGQKCSKVNLGRGQIIFKAYQWYATMSSVFEDIQLRQDWQTQGDLCQDGQEEAKDVRHDQEKNAGHRCGRICQEGYQESKGTTGKFNSMARRHEVAKRKPRSLTNRLKKFQRSAS